MDIFGSKVFFFFVFDEDVVADLLLLQFELGFPGIGAHVAIVHPEAWGLHHITASGLTSWGSLIIGVDIDCALVVSGFYHGSLNFLRQKRAQLIQLHVEGCHFLSIIQAQ